MFAAEPPIPLRVLIVDDDDCFAELLSLLIGSDSRVELVGRARDGAEGVALAHALRPDMVVMDLCMPRMDGFAATRRIVAGRGRAPAVLVVSSLTDTADVQRAMEAGASAYLPKDRAAVELVDELERLRPPAPRTLSLQALRYAS